MLRSRLVHHCARSLFVAILLASIAGCVQFDVPFADDAGRLDAGTAGTTVVFHDPSADLEATAVAWGDVDGDGDDDLFVAGKIAGTTPYEALFERSATGLAPFAGFAGSGLQVSAVVWADVDGDGRVDLVRGLTDGSLAITLNTGAPAYVSAAPVVRTPCATIAVSSVDAGDFDGDGDLDVAEGHVTGSAWVRENDGTGRLGCRWDAGEGHSVALEPVTSGASRLALGAVHGSARVVAAQGTAVQVVWSEPVMLETGAVAWGDPNADGRADLAIVRAGPDPVYVGSGTTLADTPLFATPDAALDGAAVWWSHGRELVAGGPTDLVGWAWDGAAVRAAFRADGVVGVVALAADDAGWLAVATRGGGALVLSVQR